MPVGVIPRILTVIIPEAPAVPTKVFDVVLPPQAGGLVQVYEEADHMPRAVAVGIEYTFVVFGQTSEGPVIVG